MPALDANLNIELCDVFTSTPLEGNQLAVFLDAGSLSTEEMQAHGKGDKSFGDDVYLPPRAAIERERGVRVRIFTTQEELPFAGHPTLGTAATIRRTFPEYEGRRGSCSI